MEKAPGKAQTKANQCGRRALARRVRVRRKAAKDPRVDGACHLRGKMGHYAKDCWRRIGQIEETTNLGGASSSSTGHAGGGGAGTATTQTASVKMVRLETPPEARSLEVFDLTTPRDEGTEAQPWRVGMVEVIEENFEVEEFYDMEESEFPECYEPTLEIPSGATVIAMDLQDEEEQMAVNMVRMNYEEEENENRCLITLDSGADISVFPMHMWVYDKMDGKS